MRSANRHWNQGSAGAVLIGGGASKEGGSAFPPRPQGGGARGDRDRGHNTKTPRRLPGASPSEKPFRPAWAAGSGMKTAGPGYRRHLARVRITGQETRSSPPTIRDQVAV